MVSYSSAEASELPASTTILDPHTTKAQFPSDGNFYSSHVWADGLRRYRSPQAYIRVAPTLLIVSDPILAINFSIEGSPCISALKLLRFIASLKLLTTFLILAIYVMMNKGDCKVQTFMSIRWYIPKSSKERLYLNRYFFFLYGDL